MNSEPTLPIGTQATPPPKKRRQFLPGQRPVDSRGQQYFVDKNGSVRRDDGGKMTKAERKAAKRAKRRGTNGR